jgi:hypothetical protein
MKEKEKVKYSIEIKKCKKCGNDFESKLKRGIYCSSLCRASDWQTNKKANKNSLELAKKDKCEYCRKDMQAENSNKKFCSSKCRVYSHRESVQFLDQKTCQKEVKDVTNILKKVTELDCPYESGIDRRIWIAENVKN